MTETMVIPDGITPVVGWRAWRVDGGHLKSPMYDYVWPERRAAEAKCQIRYDRPRVYARPYSGSMYDYAKGEHVVSLSPRNQYGSPTGNGPILVVSTRVAWPNVKDIYAHDGACPSENCSCGFYVTKDVEEAKRFGDVIGRVAVWGNVVEHSTGWRGQYAYPQAIYTEHPKLLKLADYGVPVLPLSEIGGPSVPYATGGIILTPATPKPSWWIEPLRWVGILWCIAFGLFEWYSAIGQLWWGATGETELRHQLGVAYAFALVLFALWYAVLARRIWRWR